MLEDFKDLRVVLEKKIKNCSSVFIVGHDGPDFDSFGAAIGLSAIARNFYKKAYIIIDDEPTIYEQFNEWLLNESNKNGIFNDNTKKKKGKKQHKKRKKSEQS